ncbi:MAG: hypothetical protein JNL63_09960 [Bacteroidia bacterium]|nr:hypothetical protein [Bacteroidia bacterium]
MKTSIAVFNSHQEAVSSIILLNENRFPLKKVSLMGKAEIIDDKIHVRSNEPLIETPVIAGSILGTTIGLLSGIGLFAIPGLGFLFGAGAVIGAICGFDLGLVTGGLGTLLLQMGIKNEYAVKYDEYVKDGKFLLMINGTNEEIEMAKRIMGKRHIGYDVHDYKQVA